MYQVLERKLPPSPTRRTPQRLTPKRPAAEAEKIEAKIQRAIRRGTGDRVRDLKVEILEEGIVLNGRCGTYYSKQRAQHAVIELMEHEGFIKGEPLINLIEVW